MRDSDLCPLSSIPRNVPSTYFDMHALTDYRFRAGADAGRNRQPPTRECVVSTGVRQQTVNRIHQN